MAAQRPFIAGHPFAFCAALCALALGPLGCATSGPDPWEPMNRGIFAFNEAADRWVLEPVAKGWDFVLPELAQTGIDNFFTNLGAPVAILNNFLQGEVEEGYLHTWRFILNSTAGVAGFVDVASMAGWGDYPEDFGLTLGTWGVPNGPYLMLPIFGASTVRDTVGLGVDAATTPYGYFVPLYVSVAARATDMLNARAIFAAEIAQSREEAFDFYLFVRSAYLQNRAARVAGSLSGRQRQGVVSPSSESDEDLYYFEDEEFEDEELDEFDEPND
jgi:phospholipid-binding lipoprotein MlaA